MIIIFIGLFSFLCVYFLIFKRKNANARSEANRDVIICYEDLTAEITTNTIVYPGDPVFESNSVSSLDSGSTFNLCHIHMGNHTGTHVDFPAHVMKGGKTSSDYTLNDLIGDGLIIDVPNEYISIDRNFINKQLISENAIIFFKTKNTLLSKNAALSTKYVYIEPEAAQALVEKKVKAVGIDYISVDNYDAEGLPVHQILLSNDILIVENLELKNVRQGKYKFFIIPLNIPNMDGLPARVMLLV